MKTPCQDCIEVRDHSYRAPAHVVHPEHGKRGVFDIFGEAICPMCYTVWRRNCDNSLEMVATS